MKPTIAKLLAISLLLLSQAFGEGNSDLDKLQGRWECKKTDENGQKLRLTLEIKKEKLTFKMDGDSTLFATADIKSEKLGPFKALTSRNVKAGEKEDSLEDVDDEFSNIYQIDGDTLYITSNFDKQREQPPSLDVYRRIQTSK